MNEINYRQLTISDMTPDMLRGFRRHQVVNGCWRKENGRWVVKPIAFVDDWTEADRLNRARALEAIIRDGGAVFAAIGNEIVGYAAVRGKPMGSRNQYLELKHLHVSEESRGKGIGRRLFTQAAEWAREHGAERLYLSAHSAVETQAFYRAMGCVEAEEYSREHVEREPCDCQMELRL